MLRHQLGTEAFNRSLKHYLEVNRGKNVVTADFIKAVEEATNTDVSQFFNQWIYGAGAPKFDLSYTYDNAKHQIALAVKQTQTVGDHVGIFRVPVEVEVTTDSGAHLYPIVVSKQARNFYLSGQRHAAHGVVRQGRTRFEIRRISQRKTEWVYQLKNAADFSDRADAAVALRKVQRRGGKKRRCAQCPG